jgi:inward rectifier potassium channel
MRIFSRPQIDPSEIEVVNAPRTPLSDLYHLLLRAPWWMVLTSLSGAFLLINALFALAYRMVGGVAGTRPGSLADAFFFSVQTFGTIGYGAMYPQSMIAQTLMTCESLLGILIVALTTGLLFAKFSVPRARMQFAQTATISPFNGTPTLMFRLGNERASQIIEAVVRVVLIRTEPSSEGIPFYRMYDLSWTVMHKLTPNSPLYGATPESLARDEVEFVLTIVGIDDASAQSLHARHRYLDHQIQWGARHADLLSERPDGGLRVDMRQFHRLQPTAPTDEFPYPKEAPESD